MLIELEKKFWENVKNGTPPPVDGSDACADFLAKKFSESTKTQIDLPDSAIQIIRDYESASNQISKLTEQKAAAAKTNSKKCSATTRLAQLGIFGWLGNLSRRSV